MQRLELPAFDEASWKDVNELFGRNPGIYRVKLKNVALDSYEPIPRLLGVDDSGLLYIGMSDAIIGRFGGLRTGIYGAYRFTSDSSRVYNAPAAHKIGLKMLRGFKDTYAKERIFIEIEGHPLSVSIPDAYDVRKHEADAIGAYARRFGEPPPFNDTWGDEVPTVLIDD